MKLNPISFLIILAFIYPVLKGFLYKFSSINIKRDIHEVGSNIAFIISLFAGIYLCKTTFIEHKGVVYQQLARLLPNDFFNYVDRNNVIYFVVLIPLIIFTIYKIIIYLIDIINKIAFYPAVDLLERFMDKKSNLFKRFSGAVFQIPRAIVYGLLITFLLNMFSMFNISGKFNSYLETSKPYNYLCREVVIPATNSAVAKQLPNVLNNSFKVVIKDASQKDKVNNSIQNINNRKVIIYYNGVTLDEGVRSNSDIDSFARELGSKSTSSKGKAKILYNWIGSNINYDDEKAVQVLNNDYNIKSGAIPTFQSRKGICFDYASLYVAMARANGLKVRLLTGEGFNGVSWVSHAWNQVYIPEESKWINVDSTFYKGGNYFDSVRFERDHRNANIAGEW